MHKRMYKHLRKAPHLQQPRLGGGGAGLGGGELALEAGDEGALLQELLLGDAKAALQSRRAFPLVAVEPRPLLWSGGPNGLGACVACCFRQSGGAVETRTLTSRYVLCFLDFECLCIRS